MIQANAISALRFVFPSIPGVGVAFSTRESGYGKPPYDYGNMSFEVGDDHEAVIANRCAFQKRLGFASWHELKQVHGDAMHMADDDACRFPSDTLEDAPRVEGDGLATACAGQGLVIKTADCQPILLAHTSGKYVAALHVGWRGNAIDFIGTGVAAFCTHYSIDPTELAAVRGPSLGPGQSQFTNFESEFGESFGPWYDADTQTVDLWQLTRDQLLAAGLSPTRIYSLDLCTHSMPDVFFSYRRKQETGRMASVIWIR